MTIKILIKNEDETRSLEVVQREYERGDRTVTQKYSEKMTIKPGESRSYYVHLLRDLVVSEKNPSEG